MAALTGVYQTYAAKGDREDLSDKIYMISPQKTPFMSMIQRGEARAALHEWQTETLAAAISTNAAIQGAEYEFTAPAATVRVGNYTQIFTKTGRVARTQEVVDKAGRESEKEHQQMKRTAEIKRDLEKTLLENIGGSAGTAGAAPVFAALGAWLKTNDSIGSGGGSPTYTSGVPAAARTDGTQRAFTETILKEAIALTYASGGEPGVLMVGPYNKGLVSGFDGIATITQNQSSQSQAVIVGAADVYVSDFGVFRVVPNRFQRERDAWLIDPSMVGVNYLSPLFSEDTAKVGDAKNFALVMECTLKVHNEAAHGLCADLSTS